MRNVTAIATGSDSSGLEIRATGNTAFAIDAVGLIARGTAADVSARAFSEAPHTPGTGAQVTISLDHSAFVDIATENDAAGATPFITAPGSGSNISAEPLFAADGYHELLGSPTIDTGAVDAFSGNADIDGNPRAIGLADIGADEFHIDPTAPVPVGAPPPKAPRKGAPNTTLKKKPARKSTSRRATFTFVSDQAGARFECKLDKRAFKSCRAPFKAKKLSRGRHSFKVRAISRAGVTDASPAVFRWKVS